ncbi:hypothetical protein EXIGLDRAFT_610679 [Exidia glandulosa HHB12029]|uniref:Helitron helicase-like domain-containing protein n=1 Tax=Exidia glandulosa HHB12029 TaxID=1314781 RepID=A0A165JUJ4_EXIGL|nr:hypothetical protein EXIGLDRAFT_610679 [Exidia glandulosa HHB12029]
MKRQVKHFLNLRDRRFQEHPTFSFTAFNLIQRRSILLQAKLKVDKASFQTVADDIAATSWDAIQAICDRASKGEHIVPQNDDERRVLRLMRQVKVLTSKVPGSAASKASMRNEIRGLMMTKGMPSWYVTVNPADTFNPIVQFLAGSDIDVDNLLPDQVPQYMPQAMLVAKNPVVAARFFNIYMHAFIKTLLGYAPKSDSQ